MVNEIVVKTSHAYVIGWNDGAKVSTGASSRLESGDSVGFPHSSCACSGVLQETCILV